MRIVLSRKGFDSAAGGGPSPVLEDGTLLSLPIPEKANQGHAPKNLETANWHKYDDLNLPPKIKEYCKKQSKSEYCHLDPDIRPELWCHCEKWQPTFGQCDAAAGHLIDQLKLKKEADKKIVITEPVLFLFFGLFRKYNGKQFYDKPVHAIWGYMVCDKVIINDQKEMPPYHPHAKLKKGKKNFNNLLFIPKEGCFGTFKYCKRLVLTDSDLQQPAKTRWKINALPWFKYLKDGTVTMSYHPNKAKCFPEDDAYFQACQGYGQEFVVSQGVVDHPELNWENCSFCQILSNLEKMYQEKGKNL